MLAAGLAGTALGLIGGRAASAGTSPVPRGRAATVPPDQPTPADVELLGFAQSVELTARDLYQVALDAGADDPMIALLRQNHQAYADVLSGLLGVNAPGTRDDALFDELAPSFDAADVTTVAAAGYELESAAVATHTELLRTLEGIEGAKLIASILIVEARSCTVLADLGGQGDDLDALFVTDADPLPPTGPTGG